MDQLNKDIFENQQKIYKYYQRWYVYAKHAPEIDEFKTVHFGEQRKAFKLEICLFEYYVVYLYYKPQWEMRYKPLFGITVKNTGDPRMLTPDEFASEFVKQKNLYFEKQTK